MKLVVSNIDWDYPGKDEGQGCPSELPAEITVDDEALLNQLMVDINGGAENLAEYLTDTYECCVCGFVPSIEGVDEP